VHGIILTDDARGDRGADAVEEGGALLHRDC
jgi:hypothetical protein